FVQLTLEIGLSFGQLRIGVSETGIEVFFLFLQRRKTLARFIQLTLEFIDFALQLFCGVANRCVADRWRCCGRRSSNGGSWAALGSDRRSLDRWWFWTGRNNFDARLGSSGLLRQDRRSSRKRRGSSGEIGLSRCFVLYPQNVLGDFAAAIFHDRWLPVGITFPQILEETSGKAILGESGLKL